MSDGAEQPGISVHSGFPNAATDRSLDSLDLHQLLVPRPNSMFLFRVRGNDWDEVGIFDGDIAVIDRALTGRVGDVIVWWNDRTGQFAVSQHQKLLADTTIWGVVTTVIHQFRRQASGKPTEQGNE